MIIGDKACHCVDTKPIHDAKAITDNKNKTSHMADDIRDFEYEIIEKYIYLLCCERALSTSQLCFEVPEETFPLKDSLVTCYRRMGERLLQRPLPLPFTKKAKKGMQLKLVFDWLKILSYN
jgi:hypothetical protein